MKTNIRTLHGIWNDGYALDKHVLSSSFAGYNEYGHAQFDTERSEAGESVYRLKYRQDWGQVDVLAGAVHEHIVPLLPTIGLIVPMPPSNVRAKQPVYEVARALANRMKLTSFENIVTKATSVTGKSLKNLATKEEKVMELSGRFSINDGIGGEGRWNAILFDDLFDSGASMEAATAALRTYKKIDGVYAVALTWK